LKKSKNFFYFRNQLLLSNSITIETKVEIINKTSENIKMQTQLNNNSNPKKSNNDLFPSVETSLSSSPSSSSLSRLVSLNNSINNQLFKPVPSFMNSLLAFNIQRQQQQQQHRFDNKYIAVAANDIQKNSQVYLLYDIPVSLLAKRFITTLNEDHFKIMVKFL
jgi:hypothetical protein